MAKSWLDKYDTPKAQNGIEGTMGGLTDKGFNYNGAWGGPSMEMGGNIQPPMAGARTQGIPSEGPYGKKTVPSAQKGKKLSYSEWRKKYNLKETPDYNLKRAWELGYNPDKTGHLPTVDNQTGQFLKAKGHPTLQLELDWYNSPEGAEFRKNHDIDSSGRFFKYIPKGQNGQEMQFYQNGLDWTPRNISEYGSEIPMAQGGKELPFWMKKQSDISQRGNQQLKTEIPARLSKERKAEEKVQKLVQYKNYDEKAARRAVQNKTKAGERDLKEIQRVETRAAAHPDYKPESSYQQMQALSDAGDLRSRILRGANLLTNQGTPLDFVTGLVTDPGRSFANLTLDAKNQYLNPENSALENATNLGFDLLTVAPTAVSKVVSKAPQAVKPATSSGSKFTSEIDWAKWNPETPTHKVLIDEYNAIEESTKKAGTWMKNPDGSSFQGTPEQFIQQQSSHFKKAFPEGFTTGYRGAHQHIDDFANRDRNDWATFLTSDLENAKAYADEGAGFYNPSITKPNVWSEGLYELAIPNNANKIQGSASGNSWRLLDINPKVLSDAESRKQAIYHNEYLKDIVNRGEGKMYGLQGYEPDKQYLSTDIYANYVKNPANPETVAQINDVVDTMGDRVLTPNTVYAVDAQRTPLKSLRHNVGFFDMTNPNIYKAVVPTAIGTTALGAMEQKKKGGVVKDDMGYWNPDNWGKVVEIDSPNITMKGVNQDLIGVSDEGDIKYMKPGKDYKFKGKKVKEYPVGKYGVNQQDEKTVQHLDQLLNFTNKPKAKNGWLDKYK